MMILSSSSHSCSLFLPSMSPQNLLLIYSLRLSLILLLVLVALSVFPIFQSIKRKKEKEEGGGRKCLPITEVYCLYIAPINSIYLDLIAFSTFLFSFLRNLVVPSNCSRH